MTGPKCQACGHQLEVAGGVCPSCGAALGRRPNKRRKKTRLYGEREGTTRARDKPKRTEVVGTPRELAANAPRRPSRRRGGAKKRKTEAGASGSAEPVASPSDAVSRGASEPPEGLPIHATRSARLPPAPSDDAPLSGPPSSGSGAPSNEEPLSWRNAQKGSARAVGTTSSGARERSSSTEPEGGRRPTRPTRNTWIGRVSRLSMEVAGRTTILELATIAEQISSDTKSRVPPRFGMGVLIAAGAVATAVLVITGALAIGFWRWIPVAFLFLSFLMMLGWGALRSLPRLARRFGALEIPGRAAAWLTLGFALVAGVSWGVTLTVSAAAEELGRAAWPTLAPYMPKRLVALERQEPEPPPPPEPVKQPRKTGKKVWVEPGLLFMPRTFEVVDGGFDLIVFFHGNPNIVKEAVPQAGINALVHVTNLGVGSSPYQTRYIVPDSLLALIAAIESETPKLGLPAGLKARRVALASWSAGYGAIHSILLDPDHVARVDALLVLDGIHGGFRPNTQRGVDPSTISPFLKFAELAVNNERLMMITHSAIPTADYTSSTEAADAMLQSLALERREVDESRSPPPVEFKAAVDAFPWSKRRWLKVRTEAHKGSFHVLGCAGDTKEDHIAHLAQMSVTVLPLLAERWRAKPAAP